MIVVASLVVGSSRAQSTSTSTATATLSWSRTSGAEGCIDAAGLRSAVSARLGRDAFASPATLSIEGVVERQPTKWIARLWVRTVDGAPIGTRELESDAVDCASLGDAVAFAVALAIDPERALAAPPSSSSSAAPSASISTIAKTHGSPEKKAVPVPSARIVHVVEERPSSVSFGGAVVAGVAPKLAPGLVVGFDPGIVARVRPVVTAALFPVQRNDERTLGVGLSFVSLGACARLDPEASAVSVDACLALLAGVTHAVVFDLVASDPGDRPWLAASVGPRFHLEIVRPIALELGADAIFPFVRRSFDATGAGRHDVLFTQPAVGVLTFAGLGIRFG